MDNLKEKLKEQGIVVIVPTFNNEKTVISVISDLLESTNDIIVVNDGSTDSTSNLLAAYEDKVELISYPNNKGKGFALKKGFDKALELGFDYAITIDSDGQHFVSDIPEFVKIIQQNPNSLLVGSRLLKQKNMPSGNTFANKFSNFWYHLQTGINLPDTQSGYRLYPLNLMGKMKIFTTRYEAELEVLVFSAWRNINIIPLKINVFYDDKENRVSHFRPFHDFFRISILNTVLVFLAIVYGYPSILLRKFIKMIFRK